MAKYIKSHSNYVLKEKHQNTSDGTIFERDITTIGGRDNFTNGQVPVYRSGNFVITVNEDNNMYSKKASTDWYTNENGDVWTSEIVNIYTKDTKSSDENTLTIKPDYRDIRDYAYFGSCSELIRGSINDILQTFPGELYRPTGEDILGSGDGIEVYYTDVEGFTFSPVDMKQTISEDKRLGGNDLYLLDNPFGINIYSSFVPEGANPLKYFADGGVSNYVAYVKKNGSWDYSKPYQITVTERVVKEAGLNVSVGTIECTDGQTSPSSFNIENIPCLNIGDELGHVKLRLEYINTTCNDPCSCDSTTINIENDVIDDVTIHLYIGNNYDVIYLVESDFDYRIRVNDSVFSSYIASLDSFEKLLLNTSSSPLYTAYFELIGENEFGYYTYTDKFTFPTTYGGYNIGSNGNPQFNRYLSDLVRIGEFYDERLSDNIWRSLTHESIKNLDLTRSREADEPTESEYEGEGRIGKILRLYGREFDEIKLYIDAIKDVNRVTYDEINNLPDYFLTDELEEDGWDVKPIYPIKKVVKCDTAFINDTSMTVMPYPVQEKQSRGLNATISNSYVCDDATIEIKTSDSTCCLPTRLYGDDIYYDMHDANIEFMRRLALNSKAIISHKGTIDGIEMLLAVFGLKSKRSAISDERTFDVGFESGETPNFSEITATKMKPEVYCDYDYEIREYSVSGGSITDTFDNRINDYLIDHTNKAKLVSYATDDYRNGIYKPYQGLPVKIVEDDNPDTDEKEKRVLCPWFDKNAIYDGNPYYQMRGGWLSRWSGNTPCMFDSEGTLVAGNDSGFTFYEETSRNIKTVGTLMDLVSDPSLAINSGDICQVMNTTSEDYALVDGIPYPLYTDGNGNRYFNVSSSNGAIVVANKLFKGIVSISNSSTNGFDAVNLDDKKYSNATYRVYVNGKQNVIFSSEESISECLVFANGRYKTDKTYTKYFRINQPDFYNEIGEYGWEQLSTDDPIVKKLEETKDYFKGNNPHTGNMTYDGGHEYFTYFAELFKYANENELFDYDGVNNFDILNTGFKGIIDEDFCNTDYEKSLISDSKCHHLKEGETSYVFNLQDVSKGNGCAYEYNTKATKDNIYNGDAIMNTKVMDIVFKVNKDIDYARYLDKVVVPYVSQMIPSTSICRIKYID